MHKHIILGLCSLLSVLFICTGCDSEDKVDPSSLTSHAYISNVQLGAIKRVVYTTDETGKKQAIRTTFKAMGIKINIDQRNRTIENVDSLLYGAQLDALLLNITYTGSFLSYRVLDGEDATWKVYSSTDSINLTRPIELCVNSKDNASATIYTLRLNVHQMEGDSTTWSKMTARDDVFTEMTDMRVMSLHEEVQALGRQTDGIYVARMLNDSTWQKAKTNLPLDILPHTLRCNDKQAFISTEQGYIYTSANGTVWNTTGSAVPGLQLAAIFSDRLYAICQGRIMRADLQASQWEEEKANADDLHAIPQQIVAGFAYERASGMKEIILVGENDLVNDSSCVVWSKTWNVFEEKDSTEWIFYQTGKESTAVCPRLNYLQVFPYDNNLYAFGGTPKHGWAGIEPLANNYCSLDYGLTWKKGLAWKLPTALKGYDKPFAAMVDSNNYIWIIAGNDVWRGRLNRLGFEVQ